MRTAILTLCLAACFAPPAVAWNATGHKLISSIAFRQLSRQQQRQIVEILKRHPRFTPDFTDEMPAEVKAEGEAAQDEWLFQQAGIWSDMVRGGPPERTAFHRSTWHYMD